jgi:hypothetical protein
MDVVHGQKFWNDPASITGQDENWVKRVKYMTGQFLKTASSLNAELRYLKEKIDSKQLITCDLMFIHIPSTKYDSSGVKAITHYLNNGGSPFLVMDKDYWSTLEAANVNDILSPFGVQFGKLSPYSSLVGYTKAGLITEKPLIITYHSGRIIRGGTPFCFSNQSEESPFGIFKNLKNGGKIIVMGDGMVSLYMTSWKGINDNEI